VVKSKPQLSQNSASTSLTVPQWVHVTVGPDDVGTRGGVPPGATVAVGVVTGPAGAAPPAERPIGEPHVSHHSGSADW
jgi:hypothetical protein